MLQNLPPRDSSFSTFDSTPSSESDSAWTLASGRSTIPGIGSLTGKAIKALGNAVLLGLDYVVIYARINAISPNFPHTDAQALVIEGIQEMYDMILELSRPNLYNSNIRGTALTMLLTQINRSHTYELEQALSRWHYIDLEIFLHTLASHSMAPEIHNGSAQFPLVLDSRMMMVLMCRIARKSERGCHAVLSVGFVRLFLLIGEAQFSASQLAAIYRTILHISKGYRCLYLHPLLASLKYSRSEHRFRAAREQGIQFLAHSMSPLKPTFIKALQLWGVDDLKALADLVLESAVPPTQLLSNDVNLSALSLLYHIGKYDARRKRVMFRAGYLNILFRLETHKCPIQWFQDEFEVVMDMLRDPFSPCTEKERSLATYVLIFQIANNHRYILRSLVRWSTTEIKELLQTLVEKLWTITTSDSGKKYRNVVPRLVAFIARCALSSDHTICEVIVRAGFLDILCSQNEESEIVKVMVTDIIQRGGYSLLVKQAATQFISCQVAQGRRESWLYQTPGAARRPTILFCHDVEPRGMEQSPPYSAADWVRSMNEANNS